MVETGPGRLGVTSEHSAAGWRLLFAAVAACGLLHSQELIDTKSPDGTSDIRRFERTMEEAAGNGALACKVKPLKPRLAYTLRYTAGFLASVPVSELDPDGTILLAVFRVSSSGGDPVYFRQRFRIPKLPQDYLLRRKRRAVVALAGGYFLGEGRYTVGWILFDQRGRYCRRSWDVNLRLNKEERTLVATIPVGTAAPFRLEEWRGSGHGPARPYRIAVFAHATPLSPRSVTYTKFDQLLLIAALTSLLRDTPFRETSVVAFNLRQQKEIFHAQQLDTREFRDLVQALDQLQLAVVDVRVLAKPLGSAELLTKLVIRETESTDPPDAVVFIGPRLSEASWAARNLLQGATPGNGKPLFFYLRLDTYNFRFGRAYRYPDPIAQLTKARNGRVYGIRRPSELGKAIRAMERLVLGAGAGSVQ